MPCGSRPDRSELAERSWNAVAKRNQPQHPHALAPCLAVSDENLYPEKPFMATYPIVIIPGDGIGPEVASAVQRILLAAKAPLEWTERHAGITALEHRAKSFLTRRSSRFSRWESL